MWQSAEMTLPLASMVSPDCEEVSGWKSGWIRLGSGGCRERSGPRAVATRASGRHLGAARGPRGDPLEGGRRLQHRPVLVHAPDDLEPDREPVARESAGHARGRIAGRVEREAERGPREESLGVVAVRVRCHLPDGERGDCRRGRQEVVVALEEPGQPVAEGEPLDPGLHVLDRAVLHAAAHEVDEAGVHLALPLVEVLDEAARDRALVGHDEEIGGVAEAGVALLHFGAELLEAGRRPRRRLRDLRVDLRVAEGGAPEDPLSRDAGVEIVEEVAGCPGHAEAVARVVARDGAQHERRVSDGAGHRPQVGKEIVVRHRDVGNDAGRRLDAEDAGER